MPQGVEVIVEDGFATIHAPDREVRADVLRRLLAATPPRLIETQTRTGPNVTYRVPEGNAREAGLLDGEAVDELPHGDSGFAAALLAADRSVNGARLPLERTVGDDTYVAGRDGNATITGPLHPNHPAVDPKDVPAPPNSPVVAEMPLELQARIKANTPQPADYAPRHTPLDERVPSGAATIATVVSGSRLARSTQVEANGDPIEYPQGEPSTKWGRDELDAYALRQHGLDTSDLPNKGAVLTAIKEGKS